MAPLRTDVRVGRILAEPATAITDWVMAGFAGFWAAQLLAGGAGRGPAGLATTVWGIAFVATSLAAAAGGVTHGFSHRLAPRTAGAAWRTTLHCVTLGSAASLAAAILALPATTPRTAAFGLTLAKLAAATALLVRRPSFGVALADHALSLAAVLALQWWTATAYGSEAAPWIASGVAVSFVAGAVQAMRIAPHPRFNHNDLYHVIQIAALWLLFRGGMLLVAR